MNDVQFQPLWTLLACSSLLGLPACAAGQHAARSSDLEVIGRLENLSYETIDDPEDILGHGWITARLHVSRTLRGRLRPSVITIRYLAHTYWRERSVRLRLRASADGTYIVCAAPGGEGLVCR